MAIDAFNVVAEPRRRQLLDQLRQGPASVSELVERLGWPQPMVSKHLRVLRQSGFVSSRPVAQLRIYSLNAASLQELEGWLRPYRELWTQSFGALGAHLAASHAEAPSPHEEQE